MKWVFILIVLVYMFYRSVYGYKMPTKRPGSLKINTNSEEGEVHVIPGKRKIISCAGSSPYQKIFWKNPKGGVVSSSTNNRVFAQSQRFQSTNSVSVLTINASSVDDSGVWVCQSEHLAQNVSICVIGPTEFENTSAEVSAEQGRSITLTCHVKGDPDPIVSWFRNEEELVDDNSSKYSICPIFYQGRDKASLLTITSLTTSDSGVYTCNALQKSYESNLDCTNTESFNITLNVKYPPVFEKKDGKKKVYGREGKIIELECEAEGFPQPEYEWMNQDDLEFSEEDIDVSESGNGSVLKVKVTENAYDVEYTCVAHNEMGRQEMTFKVLRPTKPESPEMVEQINWTTRSIILNISWTEEIFFDISEIEVQYLTMASIPKKKTPKERDWKKTLAFSVPLGDIGDKDVTASLSGLEENTEYWLRVRIGNDRGVSPWSEAFIVFTKENDEEETEEDQEEQRAIPDDSGKFYGFFFVGGVLLVGVGCTLIAKMV